MTLLRLKKHPAKSYPLLLKTVMLILNLRFTLYLSCFYAVVTGWWILFVDRLLTSFIFNSHQLIALPSYKDWVFVATTIMLLPFTTILRDITERKRTGVSQDLVQRNWTEEMLQKANEQLRKEIAERQRAAKVIQSLYIATSTQKLSFEQRLQELLILGCHHFALDIGALARIEDNLYEVVAIQSLPNSSFQITKGNIRNLEQTYCRETLAAKEPITLESAGISHWCNHPAYIANRLESYIGIPVVVAGKVYGTLSFFSPKRRQQPFTVPDKELLKLMAQWVEAEIERQQIERQQVEAEIRKALEKEREVSELKLRFISMAAHEFRAPLATILVASDLIKSFDYKLSHDLKQTYINKIQSQVKNMNRLLEDVLLIGKSESSHVEINRVAIDIESFCYEIIADINLAIGSTHKIDLCFSGTKKNHEFDENLLRQILTNLLSNAIKYSPQGSTVYLDVLCKDKQAIFKITDEGIGIPTSDREHLFESFYRASNVGKISGTGLGLAIVKNAVELQGGNITVESQEGVGTSFIVQLPTEPVQREREG